MIDAAAVAALDESPVNWRYKGLPHAWWGATPAQIKAQAPDVFASGVVGPLCTLDAAALDHNLSTMATWCLEHGVELAPHGKTHMAPQLFARQAGHGACAVTVATVSQARVYRAFGVDAVIHANELVDDAGLRWVAAELDEDSAFTFVCWVDSVRGVELMSRTLAAAGARRRVDVCLELGMAGGRTGCRTATDADEVARAIASTERLRLVGVAGYEAARGQDTDGAEVRTFLRAMRATTVRLAPMFESEEVLVTAGGSTYFDAVADELVGGWPGDLAVRTVLRSGCYLTHDQGLYQRTSALDTLRPALTVWAQVCSRPEPELALATMGRRDVSFDAGLPVPLSLPDSRVTTLNDQHAYVQVGGADRVEVGDWLPFGISHPCTVFDKWLLIPVLDERRRVVDLVHTFF